MSQSHRRSWLALAVLSAALAACATQPREHEHHGRFHGGEEGHDWQGGRGGGQSLFISPAGQPFRSPSDQPYPVAVWFAAADADHDGKLTRQELRQDGRRFFQILDANHDGVIDGVEVEAYEHGMVPEILAAADIPDQQGAERGAGGGMGGPGSGGRGEGGRGGGRMGGHGGHRRSGGDDEGGGQGPPAGGALAHSPLGAAPYSLTFVVEPVSNADADFDGKVTLSEFLAALDRRFDELDPMGQGYLTLDALPKTRVQRMKRPREHELSQFPPPLNQGRVRTE
jgi:hypothetical protein